MNLDKFYEYLNLSLKENDVIVTDGGGSFFEPMQNIAMKQGMRFVVSAYGTMGWALPAAIGTWFANPTDRIICIVGDGGFQLNIQELQTIVHHQIPLKIFYMNNGGYKTIHDTQKKYFQRFIGESKATGISFPEIEKIAKAYGLLYTLDLMWAFYQTTPVICEIKLS